MHQNLRHGILLFFSFQIDVEKQGEMKNVYNFFFFFRGNLKRNTML